jgi:hypothetical protein
LTVTATSSKGAKDQKTIEVTPVGGKVLLAGDATSTYSVSDQTTAGREEAFQFTAKSTGTVEELQFRTNGTANTGLTGLVLAVFADSSGKPGAVLGSGSVSGTPGTSSWIRVTGLSVAVTSGTKYWLVALPKGSGKLHYGVAVSSGGTGNVESKAGGLGAATAESEWETYNQGPVGFQALGPAGAKGAAVRAKVATVSASTRRATRTGMVAIAGLPSAIRAGAGVQLRAARSRGVGAVDWSASAGRISASGVFTAPAMPPRGPVVIRASARGARADVRRVWVLASTPVLAAPAAPLPAGAGTVVEGRATPAHGAALSRPQAELFDGELLVTTLVAPAGRVRVSVLAGGRRVGGCAVRTPGHLEVTCRVALHRAATAGAMRVSVALASGRRTLAVRTVAGVIPVMRMAAGLPLGATTRASPLDFLCSPALARSATIRASG